MSIFMLGLAGIPPSVGFFGKLAMFGAAVDAGRVPLVVIAVLASAVGAYYYLRIIVVMFMQPLQQKAKTVESTWLKAGLWTCSFLTLYIGTLPETYFSMVKSLLKSWL
jgi:NADH-quinone oxidoreductase subunit N